MNSLLERLRLRLRELGRPLREGPSSDGGRHSSRADTGDAPQRRTEIEPTSRRQASDRTGAGEEARLPAQQPPPPKSTRLKAAVFSKKRQPGPQRIMLAALVDRGGRELPVAADFVGATLTPPCHSALTLARDAQRRLTLTIEPDHA